MADRTRRPVTRLWLTLVALVILPACGGGSEDSPADAVEAAQQQLEWAQQDEWNKVYDQLYPIQQEAISHEVYIGCQRDEFAPEFDIDVVKRISTSP